MEIYDARRFQPLPLKAVIFGSSGCVCEAGINLDFSMQKIRCHKKFLLTGTVSLSIDVGKTSTYISVSYSVIRSPIIVIYPRRLSFDVSYWFLGWSCEFPVRPFLTQNPTFDLMC